MSLRILKLASARECADLKGVKDRLVVWWYGGLKTQHRIDVVPRCVVFFRELREDGTFGSFQQKTIGVTHLGLLRLGSIWQDGRCEGLIKLDAQTFDVSLDDGGWTFVSPAETAAAGQLAPFSQDDYQLRYERDRNRLLDFHLEGDRNLLIPCLEFFTRFYGRSAEVRRVLATYPWEQALPRLIKPREETAPPNTWPVRLTRRMHNADVVLLAHALYDEYTRKCCASIYAQCAHAFNSKENYAFLKVRPWFRGAAKLKVEGYWVNESRTFLGLRIGGGSDPKGERILRERDKNGAGDDGGEDAKGQDLDPARAVRVLRRLPDIVDLTDTEEPDNDAPSVDVYEDAFEVLGEPRVVLDRHRRARTDSTTTRADGPDPAKFSTGEGHGSGKGVGYASVHARVELESEGILRDMWKALRYLAKKHTEVIRSVEWFTFEDGFQARDEPRLIALPAYSTQDETISAEVRNWVYHNVVGKVPRGLLIVRVIASGKPVYIVEIQRRVRSEKPKKAPAKQKKEELYLEERFKGLVFTLDDQADLVPWLNQLASAVRPTRGVVQKITGLCPGKIETFKHSPASDEGCACEAAAKNALGKAEVFL
ncbi:MAG: hypothetical protein M0P72_05545 [Metallibacterium scheffleri]|jgi:hypothetical protein|uniref:hypothetical protein n=1 Tax=Metallibacterium scheffleri TaxID=993689 RepID=UPI0026F0E7D3|nr:hypothetical protein [Metallibacterium scheffleri]MCK9366594.1 hypothetical protein [Metallibacterium scheffleri]